MFALIVSLCLMLANTVYADTDCEKYQAVMAKLDNYKDATLRAKYIEAAQLLEACSNAFPLSSDSVKMFQRSYQIGNLYVKGGECSKAKPYIYKCEKHPAFLNHVPGVIEMSNAIVKLRESCNNFNMKVNVPGRRNVKYEQQRR